MTSVAIDALLVAAVAACWLGALGLARLRAPLDRLHCAAFVNATALPAIAVAALVADGLSSRAVKLLLVALLALLVGAAGSHASGRAIALRDSTPEGGS